MKIDTINESAEATAEAATRVIAAAVAVAQAVTDAAAVARVATKNTDQLAKTAATTVCITNFAADELESATKALTQKIKALK